MRERKRREREREEKKQRERERARKRERDEEMERERERESAKEREREREREDLGERPDASVRQKDLLIAVQNLHTTRSYIHIYTQSICVLFMHKYAATYTDDYKTVYFS